MMHEKSAHIAFHGSLRDFLSRGNRQTGGIAYPVTRRASLKDVVEALGVPHTEVGALKLNGAQVDFTLLLRPGDVLEVLPVAEPCNPLAPDPPLRPLPLPRLAFVADANVGRLARLLRLVGLNTAYERDLDDAAIAALAETEGRVVLTRDTMLLKRAKITHARYVRAQEPREQLREVVRFFGLDPAGFAPFTRCLACNRLLEPVDKAEIVHRLLPLTKKYYHEFHHCPACDKVYWRGSHHGHMRAWLRSLQGGAA